eukprot:2608574-Amphidinium_carterae.1
MERERERESMTMWSPCTLLSLVISLTALGVFVLSQHVPVSWHTLLCQFYGGQRGAFLAFGRSRWLEAGGAKQPELSLHPSEYYPDKAVCNAIKVRCAVSNAMGFVHGARQPK